MIFLPRIDVLDEEAHFHHPTPAKLGLKRTKEGRLNTRFRVQLAKNHLKGNQSNIERQAVIWING